MKITRETDFNKLLKEGRQGLYLLWGSEDYLINNWTAKLVKPFAEKGDFNFTELDGLELDINALFDSTQQLPVFAAQRCILLKGLNPKKITIGDTDSFEEIFSSLPPESVLVVSCVPAMLDSRTAVGKKMVALADKYGVSLELSGRDEKGLISFVSSIAKKNGCQISHQTARELIRLCGTDMLTLGNETEKVCSYIGQGEITLDAIKRIVTVKVEERVFDLSKAILSSNTQRAMEILNSLLYQKESPIGIMATLIMSYTDLYRAYTAKASGESIEKTASLFDYKGRDFRIRNAFRIKISRNALEASLDALYNCEIMMKSTGTDLELLLEKAVMELIISRELP